MDDNWHMTELEDLTDLFGVANGVIVSISNASDRSNFDRRLSTQGILQELGVVSHILRHCSALELKLGVC